MDEMTPGNNLYTAWRVPVYKAPGFMNVCADEDECVFVTALLGSPNLMCLF